MTTKVSSVRDGAAVADNGPQAQSEGRWSRPIRALFRNQMLMVGAVMVSVLFVLAILAPVLAPYDPYEIGVGPSMAPPTREQEAESLKAEAEQLQQQLDAITQRLNEIENHNR